MSITAASSTVSLRSSVLDSPTHTLVSRVVTMIVLLMITRSMLFMHHMSMTILWWEILKVIIMATIPMPKASMSHVFEHRITIVPTVISYYDSSIVPITIPTQAHISMSRNPYWQPNRTIPATSSKIADIFDTRGTMIPNKLCAVVEVKEWSAKTLCDKSTVMAADDFLACTVVVTDMVAFVVIAA